MMSATKNNRASALLLMIVLVYGLDADMLQLQAAMPNYVPRLWPAGDGISMNYVTTVTQTRDGYIWLGTRTGLVRFDGARFSVPDGGNASATGSSHVTDLFESADGSLWIGYEDGAVRRYREGQFMPVAYQANWRSGKIIAIAEDELGDIWLVNQESELARLCDGQVIPAPATNVTRLFSLARKPKGGFWIHRGNEISEMKSGQLEPLRLNESGENPYIQGIGIGRDGGLWIMTEALIRKWKDGHWTGDLGPAPWEYAGVPALVETKSGCLAAATADHGLFIISPGTNILQFCHANGFASDWITGLGEDREGNLWAATGNGGLAMFSIKNPITVSPPDQWQGRAVLSVAADTNGGLWIGTEGASLYSYCDGKWTNYTTEAGLTTYYVWSVWADARNDIWAGTWSGSVFKKSGDRFALVPGLEQFGNPIAALLETPATGLLMGTELGLLRYESNQVHWLARKPELISPDVRALAAGADGTIWLGMAGGGIASLQGGVLRQYRRADGLASDYVQCLRLDSEATLWIGTLNGLNRFKNGRFTTINKRQGLPSDVICDIQDDGLGNFWISSHGGIARVSHASLNQCADNASKTLACVTFGLSDGLPSLECSGGFQPASCRTADSRLWFPTSKGLVVVDPRNVRTNSLPPPVIIERLLVDEKVVAENPPPEATVQIGPGQHRFEFQFTALSFPAPEKVRFKYRIEGLDPDWIEVQSPRRANYSRIPPGDYRFQVQACNNDGVWNEAGATLAFAALPAFWQTWWFRIAGGVFTALAGGGIVWLDARRRMHRKLERLERERAIENERARIAKDIHDDLGASLTRISLLSGSLPKAEATLSQATEVLDRIFETTNEMTEVMDEIVWAVNPKHDTLDSLGTYLGKFAQDFLGSAGVSCRLDVPLHLPQWRLDAEVRHNLFLAFKESLHNVIRHARATEVQMTLAVGADAFTLVVQDDGKGFLETDTNQRAGGGNGLINMRQRLANIRGRCIIISQPDQGTRVKFYVNRPKPERG